MKQTKIVNGELKRIFSWIPENLHRQVKAAAALDGLTIDDWIEKVIKEKLAGGKA